MLDDLKYIHQRDGQDALGIAQRQWKQLEYEFEISPFSILHSPFSNVVYGGMGGSALAALISKSWPGHSLPFEVCRDYRIPKYVSKNTLFIASSYSGNTEETLSALAEAEEKGAVVVVIASGGKLEEIAKGKNYPFIKLPKAEQPRFATLYSLKALATIFAACGFVKADEVTKEMLRASEFLHKSAMDWLPTVPAKDNPAKKLANELAGKSIVIYAGPLLAPAAYKWKISFNENAKNIAWWNFYPELDHNEISGWISHPIEKPYAVVELRSSLEHPRVQKSFEVTERLLSGLRPAPNVIEAKGQTILEQLVWTIALGDFVSLYLALLNGLNPSPVDLQEKFKKALG